MTPLRLPPPRHRLIREALMLAAGAVLTAASVWFMLAALAALGAP